MKSGHTPNQGFYSLLTISLKLGQSLTRHRLNLSSLQSEQFLSTCSFRQPIFKRVTDSINLVGQRPRYKISQTYGLMARVSSLQFELGEHDFKKRSKIFLLISHLNQLPEQTDCNIWKCTCRAARTPSDLGPRGT